MHRSRSLILVFLAAVTLAGCYGPEPYEPGRMGRSLDRPPRYGETSRYVQPGPAPMQPRSGTMAGDYLPPQPNIDAGASLDPGLTVSPPDTGSSTTAGTPPPTPSPTPPPTPSGGSTSSGSVPYARAVPGKPGFVYSPHEAGKILDVTGLRPGTKVKDPQTGAMFRVP